MTTKAVRDILYKCKSIEEVAQILKNETVENLNGTFFNGDNILHTYVSKDVSQKELYIFIKIFLESGISANKLQNDGSAPIHLTKYLPIGIILAEYTDPSILFDGKVDITFFNSIEFLNVLNDRKCINNKFKDGRTILHYAKNIIIAKFLVENGLDVNCEDDYGQTPIFYEKNMDCLLYLTKCGASLTHRNKEGRLTEYIALLLEE